MIRYMRSATFACAAAASATLHGQTLLFGTFDPNTVALGSLAVVTTLNASESNLNADSLTSKPHFALLVPFRPTADGAIGQVSLPVAFNTSAFDLELLRVNSLGTDSGFGVFGFSATFLAERAATLTSISGSRGIVTANFGDSGITLDDALQYAIALRLRETGGAYSAQLAQWLTGNTPSFTSVWLARNDPFFSQTATNVANNPLGVEHVNGSPLLNVQSIPEPSTWAAILGAFGLAAALWRRTARRQC